MLNLIYLAKYSCKGCLNAKNPSLFRSGGKVKALLLPEDCTQLMMATFKLNQLKEEYIVVGNCSKILFPDRFYDKVVVCCRGIKGISHSDGIVYVGCGESLPNLCAFAKNNALSGLSNLCGIPASIGGAIYMNAGAYGSEISEHLQYVDIIQGDEIVRIDKAQLDFGYRYSSFQKDKSIIVGAGFALKKGNICAIDGAMKKVVTQRKNSQPNNISLGSVFKRINDISAGYYIEKVGLKGHSIGGAQISTKHANFIINKGGATSSDYVKLTKLAEQKVFEQLGVQLQLETIIL